MIFVDTSAIFAVADERDINHIRAVEIMRTLSESRETLFLHNYILIETAALIQRRLGMTAVLEFLSQEHIFQIHWIREEEHKQAVELLQNRNLRNLSLVDCMSFVVMQIYDMRNYFGFDSDFQREGFSPI